MNDLYADVRPGDLNPRSTEGIYSGDCPATWLNDSGFTMYCTLDAGHPGSAPNRHIAEGSFVVAGIWEENSDVR
jgi:hypothetical protein